MGVSEGQVDKEVPLGGGKRPKEKRVRNDKRGRALRHLLQGLHSLDNGDFRARLTGNGDPLMAEIVDVFNSVAEKHERLSEELRRVSFSVGREGNMRERVVFAGQGNWAVAADAVNNLITDLVQPTSEVSRVMVVSSLRNG